MQIEFYQPKNDTLKQFIQGYYFIAPNRTTKPFQYLTFPNNFFIVSANLGAHVELGEDCITVSHSGEDTVCADFVTRYTSPIEVRYKDVVPEVTIYFKPAGINHFVSEAHLLFKQGSALSFNPYPDYYPAMKSILTMQDRSCQMDALEQYWLSKFVKKEMHRIEAILFDMESDITISSIASKYNLSRQHFNVLFFKNIGKTPSEYRKIQRFRAAVSNKKGSENLTQLTYDNLFYDQSHMIKDFKKLTKIKPNSFFRDAETTKENVWLFI